VEAPVVSAIGDVTKEILAADQYSGGGNFSEALERAARDLGLDVDYVAINHWATAIATHEMNHPRARHLCANMYRTSPQDAVPGGRLDILIASPTCTFVSVARGGKPISRDQRYGRMTPTQVTRWCGELDVRCIVVENVPEFVGWTMVHPSEPVEARCVAAGCRANRPCKSRKGMYFRAWIRRLESLGYRLEWRILNAADFGDATTRRRFFLLGRKDGRPIRWPRPTHSQSGGRDLFGSLEKWRGAREVIDWSLKGKSIFRRKKPLARPTVERIRVGAVSERWPDPYLEMIDGLLAGKSVEHWLPPVDFVPDPFISTARQHDNGRSIDEPIPTVCASGNHVGLVEPFVLSQASGGAARPVSEPLPTIPTRGAHELVVPYYGTGRPSSVDSPLPTQTTRDRFALVVPVTHRDSSPRSPWAAAHRPTARAANRGELALIVAANGERPGQSPRFRSVSEPVPTICATGRIPLVEGVRPGLVYYDILLRMLEPEECARAMGFPASYRFVGNKGQRMRQVGNAVALAVARALIRESLMPFVEALAA
jgi:DNA (cytosine-5)-methyltransferase 1